MDQSFPPSLSLSLSLPPALPFFFLFSSLLHSLLYYCYCCTGILVQSCLLYNKLCQDKSQDIEIYTCGCEGSSLRWRKELNHILFITIALADLIRGQKPRLSALKRLSPKEGSAFGKILSSKGMKVLVLGMYDLEVQQASTTKP